MFSFAPNMELMTSSSLIKKSLQSLKTQIENKAPHSWGFLFVGLWVDLKYN